MIEKPQEDNPEVGGCISSVVECGPVDVVALPAHIDGLKHVAEPAHASVDRHDHDEAEDIEDTPHEGDQHDHETARDGELVPLARIRLTFN